MLRTIIVSLLVAAAVFPAAAASADTAEPVPDLAALFDPGKVRRPEPGDWLEYRVAFPVDPLENSLDANPVPVPESAGPSAPDVPIPDSSMASEPPAAWRVLPLRLEFRRAESTGYQVGLSFAGTTSELFLPLADDHPAAEFFYEPPRPEMERTNHRAGDIDVEVDLLRRQGDRYGFVRLSNPDLPFGLARFASESLDFILVGMGTGSPPPFPLALSKDISPEPGRLHGGADSADSRPGSEPVGHAE